MEDDKAKKSPSAYDCQRQRSSYIIKQGCRSRGAKQEDRAPTSTDILSLPIGASVNSRGENACGVIIKSIIDEWVIIIWGVPTNCN